MEWTRSTDPRVLARRIAILNRNTVGPDNMLGRVAITFICVNAESSK